MVFPVALIRTAAMSDMIKITIINSMRVKAVRRCVGLRANKDKNSNEELEEVKSRVVLVTIASIGQTHHGWRTGPLKGGF